MIDNLLTKFYVEIHTISEIYDSAIYGVTHKEVRIIKLLEKLGSKRARKKINREKLKKAFKEIEAIDKIESIKTKKLNLTKEELQLIRKLMFSNLKNIKRIPKLAREQAIISICVVYEAFIRDLLIKIYETNMESLKSIKKTLNDELLIEAIKNNNVIEKLIEIKINDVLYGSIDDWIEYLQKNIGFNLKQNDILVELFLLRNCLIHNDKKVSLKLENRIKNKRYIYGKNINITKNDFKRFKKAVRNSTRNIWNEYSNKF